MIRVPAATQPLALPLSSLLQPLTPSPAAPGGTNSSAQIPARSLGLVFLGDVLGRIAPIRQGVTLPDSPGIQIRAVRRVANAERPVVAVSVLNRAGDRACSAWVALSPHR